MFTIYYNCTIYKFVLLEAMPSYLIKQSIINYTYFANNMIFIHIFDHA